MTLVDDASGLPVEADGIVVTVMEGGERVAHVEVNRRGINASEPVALLQERPGVYHVTVEAPGYLPWTQESVEVRADECHVITEDLEARLRPQ